MATETAVRPEPPIDVAFIADLACPWCYVGLARLDRARAMRPGRPVRLRWWPFFLNLQMPPERHGADRLCAQPSSAARPRRSTSGSARARSDDGIEFAFERMPHAQHRARPSSGPESPRSRVAARIDARPVPALFDGRSRHRPDGYADRARCQGRPRAHRKRRFFCAADQPRTIIGSAPAGRAPGRARRAGVRGRPRAGDRRRPAARGPGGPARSRRQRAAGAGAPQHPPRGLRAVALSAMDCPACRPRTAPAAASARQCGAPLEQRCPDCQFVNQADERFCGGCGRPAHGRRTTPAGRGRRAAAGAGERRQVTVLFCRPRRLHQLTRELGAEAMHALADRFFALADAAIERFGGTIDKHIGDCVMAVFGAPVGPRQRSPSARCARRSRSRPRCRQLGARARPAIGDACRHRQRPGRWPAAAAATASYIDHRRVGEPRLAPDRSRRRPARSWSPRRSAACWPSGSTVPSRGAAAQGPAAGRCAPTGCSACAVSAGPAARPLVGRRAELQQIESVLEVLPRRPAPARRSMLRGEAGIGKTRLLEECQRLRRGAGFAVPQAAWCSISASAQRPGRDPDAGRAACSGSQPATASGRRRGRRGRFATAGLADRARRLSQRSARSAAAGRAARAATTRWTTPPRNRGKQETLAELVRARRPAGAAAAVDRGHPLGGPLTLRLSGAACPSGRELPGDPGHDLAPRGRSRSTSCGARRAGGSPLLTLDLGPLREDEASALASAYLDAGAAFARRCVERAAGNPLFLEQLLRHAEDSAEDGVPGSVQSLVQARLDHLPPHDRQALQAASVLGQRFNAGRARSPARRAGATTAPRWCGISWCGRSATSCCSPTR